MSPILLLVVQRIVYSLGTLVLVSMIIFAAVEVLPGDVAARILGGNPRSKRASSCAPSSASIAQWWNATSAGQEAC